ncbi:MAG: DUF4440 domain-containing protein [Chlamydiota bacterium]
MKKLWLLVFLGSLVFSKSLLAQQGGDDDQLLGKNLVEKFWQYAKDDNAEEFQQMISPAFQSVYALGGLNRAEFIEHFEKIAVGDYDIWDFKITRLGPTLIVSYYVLAQETISQQELPLVPTPKMTVFQENDQGWQAIAHANLRIIEPAITPDL